MRKRLIATVFAALVLLALALFVLQRVGSPRTYTLAVSGEPGRRVVGIVNADGTSHRQEGTLPVTFEYRASCLEYAFALADGKPGETISVHVSVGGEPWGHCTSGGGVKGSNARWGIAGWGGVRGGIGGMTPAEVAELGK